MLRSLSIQNYALITSLHINFSSGFSVVTGETGAGKSIIIGALNLLLGQRAATKVVRNGATKCVIEAQFSLNDNENARNFFLNNDNIDYDPECILRREVNSAGKSRAFINDSPASLNQLKELGETIIDIHSQHQNLLLNNENFQLNTLDILAADKHELQLCANLFSNYKKTEKELQEAENKINKDNEEQEYLKFQLQQLKEAKLQNGEQETLENEEETLTHAEEIKQSLFQSADLLQNEQTGALNALKSVGKLLDSAGKNCSPAANLSDRINSSLIDLNDIAREIDSLADKIEYSPQRLEEVRDRLNTIYSLQRKHHADSIEKLLIIQAECQSKLDNITHSEDRIKELTETRNHAYKRLLEQANKITAYRQNTAKHLEENVGHLLKELGMPHVQFKVQIKQKPQPDAAGLDKIDFLFSANRNVPAQSIAQTASGGEIARVMLAVKSLIAASAGMPAVIFDEIDAGVSGSAAQKMAEIMHRMSSGDKQVICITHLPQIAAMADAHYKVYKTDDGSSAGTHIILLDEKQHTNEIARLLSGDVLTAAAMENAEELIRQSNIKKK